MNEKKKRVLDVGNCDYDHDRLRMLIEEHFAAEVISCDTAAIVLAELAKAPADLVIVNRLLDVDHSEGVEVIRRIKSDTSLAHTPCMLLSNHAPYQAAARAVGAEEGFGKASLRDPATREKLARILEA